jgi:hypothetical protein
MKKLALTLTVWGTCLLAFNSTAYTNYFYQFPKFGVFLLSTSPDPNYQYGQDYKVSNAQVIELALHDLPIPYLHKILLLDKLNLKSSSDSTQ